MTLCQGLYYETINVGGEGVNGRKKNMLFFKWKCLQSRLK